MTRPSLFLALAFTLLGACGPTAGSGTDDDDDVIDFNAPCRPGRVVECYSGQDGTVGVGPCAKGKRTCDPQGIWSGCIGEVVPLAESCGDSIDNNCNGQTDEEVDADGDGFTTCSGNDCCDSTECTKPELVNQGAFDAPGNNLDDDCDGVIDNTIVDCDAGLQSNSIQAYDYARGIELCQGTTAAEKRWGVISAELTLANGAGIPNSKGHAIRPRFGTGVTPRAGNSLILLSTGAAAGKGDVNPTYQDFQSGSGTLGNNTSSPFPADFLTANGGKLPNAPGCVGPEGNSAMDPVMLTLTVRVPTNARSFKLDTNFFSSEFPEYTCSRFNDFFVVLLDSVYNGPNPNPSDKNLAFYTPPMSTLKYPVGVNLAYGNTGLFTQCVNGVTGCDEGPDSTITTCTSTAQLANTGLDTPSSGNCNTNSLQGGGTGWLQTSGNVQPGEIIKLRIAIWDTSDHRLDSIAAIDAFKWSVDLAEPGTVIFFQ